LLGNRLKWIKLGMINILNYHIHPTDVNLYSASVGIIGDLLPVQVKVLMKSKINSWLAQNFVICFKRINK